jgi:hypothetical protein
MANPLPSALTGMTTHLVRSTEAIVLELPVPQIIVGVTAILLMVPDHPLGSSLNSEFKVVLSMIRR